MKAKLKTIALILIVLSVLVSCNEDLDQVNITQKSDYVPYSDVESLEYYKNISPQMTNYKTMRTIAFVELKEVKDVFGFEPEDTLSETPVTIFDAATDLPEYYEFQILRDGKRVGYVTTVADRSKGDPVQYFSTEVKDYSDLSRDSKALTLGTKRVYNVSYPYTAVMEPFRAKSLAEDSLPVSPRDAFIEYLNGIPDEELNEIGSSKEDLLANYDAQAEAEQERLDNLWEALFAEEESAILTLTDEEIAAAYAEQGEDSKGLYSSNYSSGRSSYELMMITPWANLDFNFFNTSTMYCGPTALGIVLAGYNNSPNAGDFTNDIVKAGLNDTGVTTFLGLFNHGVGMNEALKRASGNRLYLDLRHLTDSFDNHWKDSKSTGLPVVLLRAGTYWLWNWDPQWHYRVIIGYAKQTTTTTKRFLWWSWTSYDVTKYYYLSDNGSDGGRAGHSSFGGYGYYTFSGNRYWEKASGERGSNLASMPVHSM